MPQKKNSRNFQFQTNNKDITVSSIIGTTSNPERATKNREKTQRYWNLPRIVKYFESDWLNHGLTELLKIILELQWFLIIIENNYRNLEFELRTRNNDIKVKIVRIFKSTSGKSSKLDVSSMDRIITGIAAGRSRMCSQSTPRKKGPGLRSSRPRWEPARRSASQQNLVK